MSVFGQVTKGALLGGAAWAAMAGSAALAQPGSTAETPPPSATPAPPIANATPADTAPADIIVTAQKRTERLQDVPASISVLSTRDLTKQGVVRFEDYAGKIPGLTLTSVRTGQTQVTLRGITTGFAQSASSTGFYVDEAPIGSVNAYTGGSSTTPDLDPSDLAQIEVLKGPQGTLYGAGAVGGLVKFVTAQPDFDKVTGRISVGGTDADHGNLGYSVRGALNVPVVTDKLVVRVSGFQRQDPGYIDNVNALDSDKNLNGATVRGFRALVSAKLGPSVRVDLQAIGQDTKVDGLSTIDIDAATLKPIEGDYKQDRFAQENSFVKFRLYNATIKADLGVVQLTSATTYQHTGLTQRGDATRGFGAALGPLLGIPGGLLGVQSIQHTFTERWVQEFRADTRGLFGGLIDTQVGLYYTHEDDTNRIPRYNSFLPQTGTALPLDLVTASILTTYQEYSAYGNATLHIGDRIDILGGVRYSHDKQDYAQDYSGLIVGPVPVIADGREKKDIVTWLASPRFRINRNNMIYARVATGYRPGGPNALTPTSTPDLRTFAPDRLTSYEAGYKATLFDRLVTLDAALFYTKWKHIQIQTSAGGFNFFVNGGSAISKGGEISLTATPLHGLNLGLSTSYTDAHLSSPAPAAGGADGDRLPYVPRWTGAATAQYTTPAFGQFNWVFGGGVNYVGKRFSDYSGKFRKSLGSYATVDLRAGIDDGRFSLSAFAKNVGDKRAFLVVQTSGLAPSATPGAYYQGALIQPRVIGLEAAFRF